MTNQIYIVLSRAGVIDYISMVIDYDSVDLSFQNHGNRLQHVIIDYESETVKIVNHGNRLHTRDNRLQKCRECFF